MKFDVPVKKKTKKNISVIKNIALMLLHKRFINI